MCYRGLGDLFTDLEFLMKFILFWVVALTTLPIPESYLPVPQHRNVRETLYGMYGATVNGTLIMCACMMIVLGYGEDIKSVANLMLPIYAILNFTCVIVFSCYVYYRDDSNGIMIPVFFVIYFLIILTDILLSYFYYNYKLKEVWQE